MQSKHITKPLKLPDLAVERFYVFQEVSLRTLFIGWLFYFSDKATVPQNPESNPVTEIVYEEYTVAQLVKDLESNALKAENTYNDKYVKITGKLSNIDSDGSYISLSPANNEFTLHSVQCFVKNDEQLNKVMEMSVGDNVVLTGKITSVGELLGYSLDIDNIE